MSEKAPDTRIDIDYDKLDEIDAHTLEVEAPTIEQSGKIGRRQAEHDLRRAEKELDQESASLESLNQEVAEIKDATRLYNELKQTARKLEEESSGAEVGLLHFMESHALALAKNDEKAMADSQVALDKIMDSYDFQTDDGEDSRGHLEGLLEEQLVRQREFFEEQGDLDSIAIASEGSKFVDNDFYKSSINRVEEIVGVDGQGGIRKETRSRIRQLEDATKEISAQRNQFVRQEQGLGPEAEHKEPVFNEKGEIIKEGEGLFDNMSMKDVAKRMYEAYENDDTTSYDDADEELRSRIEAIYPDDAKKQERLLGRYYRRAGFEYGDYPDEEEQTELEAQDISEEQEKEPSLDDNIEAILNSNLSAADKLKNISMEVDKDTERASKEVEVSEVEISVNSDAEKDSSLENNLDNILNQKDGGSAATLATLSEALNGHPGNKEGPSPESSESTDEEKLTEAVNKYRKSTAGYLERMHRFGDLDSIKRAFLDPHNVINNSEDLSDQEKIDKKLDLWRVRRVNPSGESINTMSMGTLYDGTPVFDPNMADNVYQRLETILSNEELSSEAKALYEEALLDAVLLATERVIAKEQARIGQPEASEEQSEVSAEVEGQQVEEGEGLVEEDPKIRVKVVKDSFTKKSLDATDKKVQRRMGLRGGGGTRSAHDERRSSMISNFLFKINPLNW